MKVEVRAARRFDVSIDRLWGCLTDIRLLSTFQGWGPIPGIAEAHWIEGAGELGSIRAVKNADGTTHKEEVVAREERALIEDRIFEIRSPLGLLVRDVRDRFALSADGDGARLDRTMSFELSSPLWAPAALLLRFAMRRALVRHHEVLARHLAGGALT